LLQDAVGIPDILFTPTQHQTSVFPLSLTKRCTLQIMWLFSNEIAIISSILQCKILYSGKPIFHHSPRHIHQYCFSFFSDVLLQFDDNPTMIDAGLTMLGRYPQRK